MPVAMNQRNPRMARPRPPRHSPAMDQTLSPPNETDEPRWQAVLARAPGDFFYAVARAARGSPASAASSP